MLVGEWTDASQRSSNKLLPGSFPPVDVAPAFRFGSPSAVLCGFATGLIGHLIAVGILIVFKNPVLIIICVVPVFFDKAAIALSADKSGGTKTALTLVLIKGVIRLAFCAIAGS